MQPGPDPAANPASAEAVDAILQAQGDMLGGIQNGLAAAVDTGIAANDNAIKTINAGLKRIATKAVNHQQSLVNDITGQLGGALSGAMAGIDALIPSTQPVPKQEGRTAAPQIPLLPPDTLPAIPPVDNQWYVMKNCGSDPPSLMTYNASVMGPLAGFGQTWFQVNGIAYANEQLALDFLDSLGTPDQWAPTACPGWKPQPSLPSGGGGGNNIPAVPGANTPGGCGGGTGGFDSTLVLFGITPGCTYRLWLSDGCGSNWILDGVPAIEESGFFNPVKTTVTHTVVTGDFAELNDMMDIARQSIAANDPSCQGAPPPPPPPIIPPAGGGTLPPVQGGPTGACPPCEIPATAPVSQPSCDLAIADLKCLRTVDGKLPAVGSAEWCQCIDELVAWFDGIGLEFAGQVSSIVGTDGKGGTLSAFMNVSDKMLGSFSPFFPLSTIQTAVKSSSGEIECAYNTFIKFVSTVAGMTGPQLLGLTLAKTLIRILKNLRVGWDLVAWITLDLEVTLEPLEKLIEYVENYAFQWEIPSVGEAIDCYLFATASEGQIKCWMACHGANWNVYNPVVMSKREKLSADELIQFARRNDDDEVEQADQLRLYGWIVPEEAQARVELYNELPSIADHLHWLQRNVFDSEYVKQYDLLSGFEEKFWPKFGHDLYAQGMIKDYAALHYAAHWIIPAVGQLAEMMQRLRPGRVDPSLEFTPADFGNLLAEQDIAPYYRERLRAISYRTLPLRQIGAAVQQGRFDRAELVERWQDIGFTATDAETLADTSLVTAARQVASQIHGYTAAFVSQLAEYGMIADDVATSYLEPQGYNAEQVRELLVAAGQRRQLADRKRHDEGTANAYATLALTAYEDGVIDQSNAHDTLKRAGYSDDAATLAVTTSQLRIRKATADLANKAIHRAFRYGAVDASGAVNALMLSGFAQDGATVIVQRWQLEMSVPRIEASIGSILRWVKKGLMSVANATERLLNLGMRPDDATMTMLEVEQDIQLANAKAAARNAKQLAQAQAAAKKAVANTQKAFCRLYTPGKMVKWFALRIINEEEFRGKLEQCGYAAAATDALLAEAKVARAHKDQQAAKKGATGIEYTGPGAVPGGPPA